MYYEINVALNGVHFFATDERSVTSEEKLGEVLKAFRKRFKNEDGVTMTVSQWVKSGRHLASY